MSHRSLAATFALAIFLFGAASGHAQSNGPAQADATVAVPSGTQKIVTKDPEYLKLLKPPEGNDFLKKYSQSYRDRAAEIEAKVGGITDQNLQNQSRNDEWITAHKNDGDKFTFEAETAYREAKISFSQKHKDGWYEAGRVYYDENNSVLAVMANNTSPIDAGFRFPMKVATLNQIYDKFHQVAAQEVEQKAHDHVSKAEPNSTCVKFPDLCFQYSKKDIEETLRSQRIEVVAQGDMEAGRIDRLMLVDYDTESVLLDLDATPAALSTSAWRFSVGPVPAPPVEPISAEAVVQAASAAAVETLATPIKVPSDVTAASIINQTKPEYPPQARARGIQGAVVLHATIDKEGKISEVQVLEGDDVLAQSASEAVRQWRYKPMMVDGEAREVDTTITVTFSLKE